MWQSVRQLVLTGAPFRNFIGRARLPYTVRTVAGSPADNPSQKRTGMSLQDRHVLGCAGREMREQPVACVPGRYVERAGFLE